MRAKCSRVLPVVFALSLVATACTRQAARIVSTCAAAGDSCAGGATCCSGLTCDAAAEACVAVPTCVGASGSCANGEPCCSGTACVDGTCISGCPDQMCIPPGQTCHYNEQCCGAVPCVPDSAGILRCFTCKPDGAQCSGANDTTCCAGTSCVQAGDLGNYKCLAIPLPPVCAREGCCLANGQSCSISAQCCSGLCGNGTCVFPEPVCIALGDVCQFSEQCCGGAPCVPDKAGILRCFACKPDGAHCSGADDASCCAGTSCVRVGGVGKFTCVATAPPPPNCMGLGEGCSNSAQCCSGVCDNTGTCNTGCVFGASCTANSDCCPGLGCYIPPGATSGTCMPPCVGTGGSCTVDGDCCSGNCGVPAGATSGTCQPRCVWTGGSCTADDDCCSGKCDVQAGATSGTCSCSTAK